MNYKQIVQIFVFIVYFIVLNVCAQTSDFIKVAKQAAIAKDFEKCIKYCDYVIKQKNTSEEAWLLKGKCKLEQELYSEALDCFNTLTNLKPQESLYFYYRGISEWKLKRLSAALKSMDKALLYSPDNLLAYKFIGSIYYELDIIALAKKNFDMAIDIDPEMGSNTMMRTRFMQEYCDEFKTALRIANLDIKRYPNSTTAYMYRGILKAVSGDNWGAYLDFEKAAEINPDLGVVYFYKGYTEFHIRKFVESIESLHKYQKQYPSDDKVSGMLRNIQEITQLKVMIDEQNEKEDGQIFLITEVMPEFEGGMQGLYKYINKHLAYPREASQLNLEGRVLVSFVINSKGEATNIDILKGIGGGCELEVIRILQNMPKWKPGKQNGRPVSVRFTIPVIFKLSQG